MRKLKILDQEIVRVTPAIYASVAIAMNQQGFTGDQIEEIFSTSQAIWNFHQENHTIDEMLQQCEELTGILLWAAAEADKLPED